MISLQMGLIAEVTNPLQREGYFNSWVEGCILQFAVAPWVYIVEQLIDLDLPDKRKHHAKSMLQERERVKD